MQRLTLSIISFLAIFTLAVAPITNVHAEWKGLVPCGTEKYDVTPGENGTESGGGVSNPCTFKDFFVLINNVIDYIFKFLVIPIAVIMFAYAGFLMLFSGGNAGKSEKAKGIFINVVFGLIIAAASWLIIHSLLQIVGIQSHINTFGL